MDADWIRDRVVLVTGAASGIGAALCRRFGRAGGQIALLDRDASRLAEQENELKQSGIRTFAQPCDVADADACGRAVAAVVRRWGGVDVLINNAGITHRGPFREAGIPVCRRVMDVNFFGAVNCTKAALESLIAHRGMVIAVSSIAGLTPVLGRSAYCASKHALHGFFDTLRAELRGRGVHVMIVCPGFTRTGLQDHALRGDGGTQEKPRTMVGREAEPGTVAEAVFRGAGKKKRLLVLTATGRFSHGLHRLLPGVYERLMAARLRREIGD